MEVGYAPSISNPLVSPLFLSLSRHFPQSGCIKGLSGGGVGCICVIVAADIDVIVAAITSVIIAIVAVVVVVI